MIRFSCIVLLLLILLGTCPLYATERFPPPDFDSGYELPLTTTPPPRAQIYQYLDMAVLLVTLSLASYLALKKRSRRGIFLLTLFSLIYFGFWRKGCVCPIGAIQNITLALFDHNYIIPFAVIFFFILPLIFTLFFGRTFCAAVCPLGAIQDIVLIHPIQLPSWLTHALGLLGYIYLGSAVLFAATGSAFIICQYDPFVSFFRMSGSLEILILGCSFLLIGLFVGRPYCRFFCPYGIILRLLSKFSRWRVTITPDDCIQCRLCEDTCPFGAIQKPYQARPPASYRWGKIKLLILILILPILMAVFSVVGAKLAPTFSCMHERVRLADQVQLLETKPSAVTTDAVDAFRASGETRAHLFADVHNIENKFLWGTTLLGGFIGLLISCKLIGLTLRRSRVDYQADRGLCLACGRCFEYCPREHLRRKSIKQL